MKRFLIAILLCAVSVEYCCAQNNTVEKGKTLLQEYIAGVQNHADVTPLVVGIKELYEKTKIKERAKFKEMVAEKISEQLSSNQKESTRSLINVYQMIAEPNDRKLPMLYYFLGNMYAEQKDSTNLKNIISSLEMCANNSDKSSEYLFNLNEYLDRIRNYKPVTYGIEGVWITDACEPGQYYYNRPKYKIETFVEGSMMKYKIEGAAIEHFNFKHDPLNGNVVFSILDNGNLSQIEKEFGEDSIYIFWSSEKLSNTNLETIAQRRYLAGAIGTSVSVAYSNGSSDFSSQLAGGMIGGLAEIGMNALFDAIFEPSKRLVIIEAWLKKVNLNMFEGVFSWKESKVGSSTTNLNFEERIDSVALMRWTKESDVVFVQSKLFYPYAPYEVSFYKSGSKKRGIPYWKDMRNDKSTEFGQVYLRYKKTKNKSQFIFNYNYEQMDKLKKWCLENK